MPRKSVVRLTDRPDMTLNGLRSIFHDVNSFLLYWNPIIFFHFQARELFKKILPEEEFLPKAPNPEDIIYVDDTEAKVSEDSSQSEFGTQESGHLQSSNNENQSEIGTQDSDQSQLSIDKSQSEEGTHDSKQSQPSKDNSQSELGIQDPDKGCIQSESAEQDSNQSQI